MRKYLLVVFILISWAGVNAGDMTFDDLYGVTKISDPQISPDGSRIAFTVTTTDLDADKSVSHIWTVNADGTGLTPYTSGDRSCSSPRWSPDGSQLYFLSSVENLGSQLCIYKTGDKTITPLSSIYTGVGDITVLPDGSGCLFVSSVYPDCADDSCNQARTEAEKNNPVKAKLYDHLLYRHYNHWYDGRVEQVFKFDFDSGTHNKIFPTPFGDHNTIFSSYAVSPDGQEICVSMSTDTMPAVYINYDLFTVPVTGGEPQRLTTSRGHDRYSAYSPDGRYLTYLQMARAGYESDQQDLLLIDRQSEGSSNLTPDFDRSVGDYVWSPDSKAIFFSVIDKGLCKIYKVDIESGEITLVLDGAVFNNLRISPDGSYLVFTKSLSHQPYELYRYDLKDKKLSQLTHFNAELISKSDMKPAEEFWFAGFNGDSIHGFLTYPPDYDPSKKYPMVLLIHGGPQWCWLGDFNYYGWNTQLTAAEGYIVAQLDSHGSVGYGLKFKEYVSTNWGKGDYEDLLLGVDYLIAHYPAIDSTRLAAMGRSYGGFMTNWICGHTDRFKCLVTVDGTYNHLSDYGSTEELWFPEWEFNGTPWSNPEEYMRSSPMTYAENFKTPTLVVHSQIDYRVDLSEGLQMFTALQRMGVPSQLLYFPDEGHSVHKLRNLRHVYEVQYAWLKRWLE